MKLYIESAEVIGEDVYFTAFNTLGLYRLSKGKISLVDAFSVKNYKMRKFSGIVGNKNRLWMIPWDDNKIWTYDIKQNKMDYFCLPNNYLDKETRTAQFRKPIVDGDFVWALPRYGHGILRININTKEIVEYVINQTEFSLQEADNFKMGAINENKLYLFKDKAKYNLIFDIVKEKVEKWEVTCDKKFGNVINNHFFISPVKKGECIERIDGNVQIPISEEVWGNENAYQYWYVDKIDNKLFFLPHNAHGIWIIDSLDNSKYIDMRNVHYNSLVEQSETPVYEIKKYNKEYLVVPYLGDKLYTISDNNELKIFQHASIEEKYRGDELESFIKYGIYENKKQLIKVCEDCNNDTVGKRIFCMN